MFGIRYHPPKTGSFGKYVMNKRPTRVVPTPPAAPTPIAKFDLNNYAEYDTTIPNSISGGQEATINISYYNTFNQSNPSNKYLELYAPNNYPDQTSGLTLPQYSNIKMVEMWVKLETSEGYGQYFIDARVGAANGFWISANGGTDAIGLDYTNGKLYLNTVGSTINPGAGQPTIVNNLYGRGWTQVIIIYDTPVSDDIALFMRFSGEQGMPIHVAEVSLYDAVMTDAQIKDLYNSKRERYSLPEIL